MVGAADFFRVEGNSFGAAWGDYDNDGFIDLFVESGAMTFPAPGATNDAQRFYRAVWQ